MNITGNSIVDTIIFAVIGLISGSIAFGLVGFMFDFTGNYNSKDMSEMHWGIRVLLFCILTFVMVKIAQFFRWLLIPPQLYFLIASIVLIIVIIVVIYINRSKTNIDYTKKTIKEPSHQESSIESKESWEKETIKSDRKIELCPYCNGYLVNRIGRYGRFIGCSNFPKCKYSRKQ